MDSADASTAPSRRRDASALLAELRLPRQAPAPSRMRHWPVWLLAGATLAVTAVVLFLRAGEPPPTAEARIAPPQARPVTAGAATPPARVAAPAPADSVLDATGYVVARRQATVSARTTGKVREILIEEGMRVEQGQIIARLDDSVERAQLELATAELDAARAATRALAAEADHARRMLDRARTLAAANLLSQTELEDRLLAAQSVDARLAHARRHVVVAERGVSVQRRHLEDLTIRAPFAGVVIEKAAQPGEMVSPVSAGGGYTRTGLGTIVDMQSLEVAVDVNEAYISRVYQGQAVRVTLNAYPDRGYAAEVLAVIPAADRTRATVAVRVGLHEVDARVLPEMGVRVAFLDSAPEPGEAVP